MRNAAFSASSRNLDLNGEVRTASTSQGPLVLARATSDEALFAGAIARLKARLQRAVADELRWLDWAKRWIQLRGLRQSFRVKAGAPATPGSVR